jgi:Arc/MetJ-type ribon-helix-helix transcriptional regulator
MANRRYPCGASFFMSEEMDATIRDLAAGAYLSDVIRELLDEALKARAEKADDAALRIRRVV